MLLEKIKLDKALIELLTPNIVLITIKNKIVIEANDIIEMKKVNIELTQGKAYAIVAISGEYSSISAEARVLLASNKMEVNRKAIAFVFDNLALRLLARFYIKINKPSSPTQSFSTKEEAINWVKEYL